MAEAADQLSLDPKDARIAIQGFGNAGSIAARLMHDEHDSRIVAVSDSKGAILNGDGLDPHRVIEHKEKTGSVVGFPRSEAITPEVRTRIVAEAANGPTVPDADIVLAEKGVCVLPDILANAAARSAGTTEVRSLEVAVHVQDHMRRARR